MVVTAVAETVVVTAVVETVVVTVLGDDSGADRGGDCAIGGVVTVLL
jgi:hypothetical protein